jgi:hypothetical protein
VDSLTIPKHRSEVEVTGPGGDVRRYALFLSERTSLGTPERITDLLNGPREFLPAIERGTEQLTLLCRSAIAVARVAGPLWDVDEQNVPLEHEVEVLLESGHVLRGVVTYVRPDASCRVVDYLNDPAPFFVVVEGDQIAVVNKRHVHRVTLK